MKRPLFAVIPVLDAAVQVCAMAENPKDLRRAVSVMEGMIKEVSDIEQLDVLNMAARYLWTAYIQQDTQRDVSGGGGMTVALNTAAGELQFYWFCERTSAN